MTIGNRRDIHANNNAITLAFFQRLFVDLHAYILEGKSLQPLALSKHPRKWWGEDPTDIHQMRQEMQTSGILPRDAIHLAVMQRLGLTAIASDDEGFDSRQGIDLFMP